MSLGMEERSTKSFWSRPEGTTGMIALAAGAVGLWVAAPAILAGLTTISAIMGSLIGIAAQTILLIILGTVAAGILFVVTNPGFQALMKSVFKSTMRWITQWWVEIDPIGIMKNYVKTLKDKREDLGMNRDKLKGQKKALELKIASNEEEANTAMSIAKIAQQRGNAGQVSVKTRHAMRMEKLNKTSYGPLLAQITIHLRALDKMYEVTGTVIEDLENEVRAKEDERKMIKTSWSAIMSAKAILQGGSDRELYDQALEFVVEDYAMKLGEIESFLETSKSFVDGLDMQNGVYEAEGLKRLQEWEQRADSVLLGNEKAAMLEHTTIQSPMYTSISVPAAGQVDYTSLIERK